MVGHQDNSKIKISILFVLCGCTRVLPPGRPIQQCKCKMDGSDANSKRKKKKKMMSWKDFGQSFKWRKHWLLNKNFMSPTKDKRRYKV